jgi:hypothetical protein
MAKPIPELKTIVETESGLPYGLRASALANPL